MIDGVVCGNKAQTLFGKERFDGTAKALVETVVVISVKETAPGKPVPKSRLLFCLKTNLSMPGQVKKGGSRQARIERAKNAFLFCTG
jgi:hypothetical protein